MDTDDEIPLPSEQSIYSAMKVDGRMTNSEIDLYGNDQNLKQKVINKLNKT